MEQQIDLRDQWPVLITSPFSSSIILSQGR